MPRTDCLVFELSSRCCSFVQVCFSTNGGAGTHTDVRSGSLDEAIKVCMVGGLQGIVSDVKALFNTRGNSKNQRVQAFSCNLI